MQLDVNPYRILIIEDNLGDKVLIEEYLNARVVAAELLWAESLKEARKRIAEEQFFDVISEVRNILTEC